MNPLGSRKFLVVAYALVSGTAIAFLCKPEVLSAYAGLVNICVGAFLAAHAVADSKWGNGKGP